MKKSLTKLIVSCAAVTAVAAAMAVSASAAAGDVAYDKNTTTITNELVYAEDNKPSGQATILVQKKTGTAFTEGDIFYIDQQASEGTVPTAWTSIKVAALENGTYVLKMGGTGVTDLSATTKEFTVGEVTPAGEKVLLGNVIGETAEVDGTDALVILRYSVDNQAAQAVINTPKQVFIANINGDKKEDGTTPNVDGTDALIALRASVDNAAAKALIKEVDYVAE